MSAKGTTQVTLRRRVTVVAFGVLVVAVSALPGEARPSGSTGSSKGADLAVTMSDAPDPVVAGADLTYTIVAKNKGPEAATGVQITDTLPATVTWKQTASTKGNCEPTACVLGTLSKNESATITIKVVPQSAGTVTNQATITADQPDPTAANNTTTVTTTVTLPPNPEADLEVTNVDSPDPYLDATFPEGGDPLDEPGLTYTITVSNHGPATAMAAVVTGQLPDGASVRSKPSFCAVGSRGGAFQKYVTCQLGSIDAGSRVEFTVVVGFCLVFAGTVESTAQVTSESPDPTPTNNTATAETTVLRAKRLAAGEACAA